MRGGILFISSPPVAGFTRDAIKEWANVHLAPGTVVTSDGLGCFAAVIDAGCVHMPSRIGWLMQPVLARRSQRSSQVSRATEFRVE